MSENYNCLQVANSTQSERQPEETSEWSSCHVLVMRFSRPALSEAGGLLMCWGPSSASRGHSGRPYHAEVF